MFNIERSFDLFNTPFKYQNKTFAQYSLICLNVTIKVSIKRKR